MVNDNSIKLFIGCTLNLKSGKQCVMNCELNEC